MAFKGEIIQSINNVKFTTKQIYVNYAKKTVFWYFITYIYYIWTFLYFMCVCTDTSMLQVKMTTSTGVQESL